ncbi:glycerophosphodiester phosphodiesterase family protein [Endozoicomonadaceae bacterium StTr2]
MNAFTKAILLGSIATILVGCNNNGAGGEETATMQLNVQVGPRPYFLVDDLPAGELKTKLQSCSERPFYKSEFSIGHRGAAMQFPEHTRESYEAAARMGAGILECDVTFTKDKELVCRHSQCDLHTTTNILATSLANQCSEPFTPAANGQPAAARCCTSDITLAQFKTLKGKMDAADTTATTVEGYMDGTASWRTDLYASRGTLMTHRESIELFKNLGVKMTPELKVPSVSMPFEGFSAEDYARKMVNEYQQAGVPATDVYLQSFTLDAVKQWISESPKFGKQAVYLDNRVYKDDSFKPSREHMEQLYADGIRYIAPPMWALVTLDENNRLAASEYTRLAKAAGLKIITWTLERSGPLAENNGGWYYQTIKDATGTDSDQLVLLDFLAQEVGVEGIFADWPGTVTYYANCMGLK